MPRPGRSSPALYALLGAPVVRVLVVLDAPLHVGLRGLSCGAVGGGGRGGLLLLLLHHLIWVAVEEQVRDHLPRDVPRHPASHPQHLPGQEPPQQPDAVGTAVVAGDRDVELPHRAVGVAEGEDGDVAVRGLGDGLVVRAGVRHNEQARLAEGLLRVIGEHPGGEATGNIGGTGVVRKLQHGALSKEAGGDDHDVFGILNGYHDASCENQLFPSSVKIDNIDAVILFSARNVPLNTGSSIFGADVNLAS